MKEYEYSFEVKSLEPYIDFCKKNNYILENKNKQKRVLYKNPNKTMGRITINTLHDGAIIKQLDFKEDKMTGEVLTQRKESLPLEFSDEKAVHSILDFLDYKKDTILIRTREVYKKNNITFELDYYEQPKKTFVVAIEGKKDEVDAVYEEIKSFK